MEWGPLCLFCTWHVDKAWKDKFRSKIKDDFLAAVVYQMLRLILQQLDEGLFVEQLSGFMKQLENPGTNEFLVYFQTRWATNARQWAYCYRLGLGINTNMSTEAFHRVFKYNYLGGKYNKRVDVCLVNLLKFSRDQAFGRLIKLTKGKNSPKIQLIHARHKTSTAMDVNT